MKWLSVSMMLCGVHQWAQLLLGAWDSPKQVMTSLGDGHFLQSDEIEQLFHARGILTRVGTVLLVWETITLLMFNYYVSHYSTRLLFLICVVGLAYMSYLGEKNKGTSAGEYIRSQQHTVAGFVFIEMGILSWCMGV